MNLFEFPGCSLGLLGALAGGAFGQSLFGWPGAVAGVAIGALSGWIAGVGLVGIGFFIGITKERFGQI